MLSFSAKFVFVHNYKVNTTMQMLGFCDENNWIDARLASLFASDY
ncbi:hypothetical protein LCGC14_0013370 [marine sediment metagenome]|uniref:Uncharacterized protein n=1 Tax=marine sediment metagenome TaxID=412755 RepID=A0A0F9WH75_9ZZZZ